MSRRAAGHLLRLVALVAVAVAAPAAAAAAAAMTSPVAWEKLPPIPDAEGFASPFAGVSNGALVVAGGANFPEQKPWEGGTKVWHDRVFVLPTPADAWREAGRLPRPLAYGLSVTAAEGVICIGGSDARGHYADAFILALEGERVSIRPLPALPVALANACGAMVGRTVHIVGGTESPDAVAASRRAWALNLDRPADGWKELPPLPGEGRMLAVAGVQEGALFIFGGVALTAGPDGKPARRYLRDAWRYDPPRKSWRRLADLPGPRAAGPSPAMALGQAHLLLAGGDDGTWAGPQSEHPGFPRQALAYHTVTNTWATAGDAPFSLVTTPTVRWDGRYVVPGGERRPGVRSNDVWAATPTRAQARFGLVNYATLTFYPLVMLAITWWVGRKATSDEFFRGGQRIPWWAAGLSIYATMLSSITFMAIPAKAYVTDWSFALANLSVPLLAPVIVALYLPLYRRLDVTSAYEYLERRFNLVARWFGSASFILLQLGRTAIVLYLPALALAKVSNFEMRTCIVIMGVICVLMTFRGGLESVVWTDVAQTVILLLGAGATLAVALWSVPGGAPGAWTVARADAKFFEALPWTLDLTLATGWVILVGNLFLTLISYTAGQDIVQRYVSTKDSRAAARSIWTNALMVIPSTVIFFAVGTALYAFYKLHPSRLEPSLENDAIFPLFIVHELPAGVGGLVVAGIFAAAQPTASLNSIATAYVTDFHARLWPGTPDAVRLRLARWITVAAGVLGAGGALLMTTFRIASAWDTFLGVLGLTGSVLAGLFALGMFTRRANGAGAVVGTVAGVAVLLYVWAATPLHFFTYATIGILTCCGVGYLASLVLPGKPRTRGLTLHTISQAPAPGEPCPTSPSTA